MANFIELTCQDGIKLLFNTNDIIRIWRDKHDTLTQVELKSREGYPLKIQEPYDELRKLLINENNS